MKDMLKEFKSFAIKGNAIDLAVGVVIGAAFGKIVTSLVSDVIMPPLGLLLGGVDFADKAIVLKAATADAPAIILGYGLFINSVIDFLIIAWAIFMVVRILNKAKKKEEDKPSEPAKPSEEVVLLTEIRDALKK